MAAPFFSTAPLFPSFNRRLKLRVSKDNLTSDVGAILVREIMDQIGIMPWLRGHLIDPRDPTLIQYSLEELLRSSILLQAQGWQDMDDADTLRHDPALRLAASSERGAAPVNEETLPSQPTLSRLKATLADKGQRYVLRQALVEVAARRVRSIAGGRRLPRLTIDIDSLPIEVYGRQPGSEYNGHYHCQMYHPLIATAAEIGDILDMRLRPGNVHTAEDATDFILDLLRRVRRVLADVALVRMDAGFPEDKLLSALEADHTRYLARIKRNAVLDRMAAPHIGRRPGRPPTEGRTWFHEFKYRAEAWSRVRRVVLVVVEKVDELVNNHFWLLTDIPEDEMDGEALLRHYRQRGTAEGHFGEYKDVLAPLLSAASRPRKSRIGTPNRPTVPADVTADPAFARNEVSLIVAALAYNLMHIGRTLVEAATGQGWSLRRFRQQVLRAAGRVTTTAGIVIMDIQGHAIDLWRSIWPAIGTLRPT